MPIPSPADFRNKTKKHSEVREMLAQMAENVQDKSKTVVSYLSLSEANADIANIPLGVSVRVLSVSEGGDYYKATSSAASLTKSPYDPLTQAKDYIVSQTTETVASYDATILTEQGAWTGTSSAYSRSGLIPIFPNGILELTTQLYETNVTCRFYDIRKTLLSAHTNEENYNGIVSKRINAPVGAFFVVVVSANSNRSVYIPYTFKLKILKKATIDIGSELVVDYDKFNSSSAIGSTYDNSDTYRHMVIPVIPDQTIEFNGLKSIGLNPVRILDSNYDVISSHNENTKQIKIPANAKYLYVQTYSKSNPSYTDEWASEFYFRRGYADRFIITNLQNSLGDLSTVVESVKNGNVLPFDIDSFSETGSGNGYKRTKRLPTKKHKKLYIRGLVVNAGSCVRGYSQNGEMQNLVVGLDGTLNRYSNVYDIPDDIVEIDVNSMVEGHVRYDSNFQPLVILGESQKDIAAYLNKNSSKEPSGYFGVKNNHPASAATTYDTAYIPMFPGMSLKYTVAASGSSGVIAKQGETRVWVRQTSGTIESTGFGYIALSTFNSTHASYQPSFIPKYQLVDKELTQVTTQSVIQGEYLPTPTLKTVREVTYNDGTQKTAIQYLWHDDLGNFYISSSLRGQKQFIFKFDPNIFYDSEPHHFSMGFDKFGNIICVFRIEHLSKDGTDSVRKNPIILMKNDNYAPRVIDLGASLKPSGWLQNCGFLCTDDHIMLTEYTRPSVATANTWKVTYPIEDPSNWRTVQSFDLKDPVYVLKHIHNVDKDPFTGVIYTSTGDFDSGAGIFASIDNGDTFNAILTGSEKYCRVLNWVFTKDWIYWATDSLGDNHWLFKAPRNASGVMDTSNITDILRFPYDSWATYATIYMPKINALVFMPRADGVSLNLPMEIYDLESETLKRVDVLKPVTTNASVFGFRCECFEWIPKGNEIPCGFSQILGDGGYQNNIGILGNTNTVGKKVNNIILTVERIGNNFTISYDTVVL